jgi:hypothetical protein
MRLVTILMDINVVYGKITWYIGVFGFFLFFLYKYRIDTERAKLINDAGLVEKLQNNRPLGKDDAGLASSILCGLKSKKDRINFFFIFWSSILTFFIALYFDFIR